MNRRIVLLLILVALAALAWWLSLSSGATSLAKPLSDFMIPDTSKVDRIFIAQQDGRTVDLRRRPDNTRSSGRSSASSCCWDSASSSTP